MDMWDSELESAPGDTGFLESDGGGMEDGRSKVDVWDKGFELASGDTNS